MYLTYDPLDIIRTLEHKDIVRCVSG